MKESNFQFKSPILKKLNYQLNDNFDINKFEKVELNFHANVIGRKSIKQAVLKLCGEIGKQNENSPFYIELEMEAYFKWNDDIPEEVLEKLLQKNGSALLLSYMRPIVAFITSQSGIASYNIPYIDFTKEDN